VDNRGKTVENLLTTMPYPLQYPTFIATEDILPNFPTTYY